MAMSRNALGCNLFFHCFAAPQRVFEFRMCVWFWRDPIVHCHFASICTFFSIRHRCSVVLNAIRHLCKMFCWLLSLSRATNESLVSRHMIFHTANNMAALIKTPRRRNVSTDHCHRTQCDVTLVTATSAAAAATCKLYDDRFLLLCH